jgi:hypothetical protein
MRHTIRVAAALTLACLWTGDDAWGESLPDMQDYWMVKLLNARRVIETPEPAEDLPFRIRLFWLRTDGECDDTPLSCPIESVYIAVSESEEYSGRKVYQLPFAHGWELDEWLHLPTSESADEYFEFTMTKRIPATETSAEWWSKERYKVRANPYGATLERLEP